MLTWTDVLHKIAQGRAIFLTERPGVVKPSMEGECLRWKRLVATLLICCIYARQQILRPSVAAVLCNLL